MEKDVLENILNQIMAELERAEAKFPQWPVDPIHAAAIVSEEAGELIRAAVMNTYEGMNDEEMKKEAIQTAVVSIRFLCSLHNEKYVSKKRYE